MPKNAYELVILMKRNGMPIFRKVTLWKGALCPHWHPLVQLPSLPWGSSPGPPRLLLPTALLTGTQPLESERSNGHTLIGVAPGLRV